MKPINMLKEDILRIINQPNPVGLEDVLANFQIIEFNKKDKILEYGQTCKYLYFVIKGGIKSEYQDQSFNTWIRDIVFENEWCCSLNSFINEKEAEEELICIENTTVYAIHKDNFDKLLFQVPGFGIVYQKILTQKYVELNQRMEVFLGMSAKERIEWLFINKIKLTRILSGKDQASFLHLNKDVFHRLRKSNSKK
jgi:signal-transduction protein with cAMP-binding, CBS, and nucleotidyltransferase domain